MLEMSGCARRFTFRLASAASSSLSSCLHRVLPASFLRSFSTSHFLSSSSTTSSASSPSASVGAGRDSASSSESVRSFGFSDVPSSSHTSLVSDVFRRVASKYDLMNDVMSVGIHRYWKHYLITHVLCPQSDTQLLDLAGGTGDVAFRFLEYLKIAQPTAAKGYPLNLSETHEKNKRASVIVCDINDKMLAVGEERARKAGYITGNESTDCLRFVEGNAEHLPFPAHSFDAITIAFGLRNVTNIPQALSDCYRVLRRGGRLIVLEFSHLPNPFLQQAYDTYSFWAIPTLGQLLAGEKDSYQYLVESIRKFPKQEQLKKMMENEKFKMVKYENLTFGVVAIHTGMKLD